MEPDYQGQPITTPDAPPFVPGVTDQRYTPEKEKSTEPMTVPDDPPYIEGITDKRFAPKVEENVEENNYNKLLKDAKNNISDVVNFDDSVQEEPQLSQIESEKLVAQNNWVKESLGNIDSALLDYENFSPQSSESVKNQALIRATMEVELGYDPPTISEYEIGRGQAYKQLFGKDLSEDLGDPEQAFVSALTNRATEKRDQVAFNETIRNEALLSALTGWSKYDASWGEAAKADPVYQKDPAAAANKFKSFKQAFEDEFNDVIPIVRNLDKFIRNNDMDSSLRLIENLEEEEFSKTAKLLGFIEKQTLATKGEEGLLSNLAKSTGRDFESFSRKFKEGFLDLLSGISVGPTGPAGFQDIIERDKVNGFLAEIKRFRDQRDPIKLLAEEDTFLSSAEKALYATPGVGFSIAGSILTGPAGTMGLLMESNQEDYYLRAIDAGVSREESNKLATTVGSPIALLQFIPERIGLGAVTRKLPVLDNVVNKITQKHFRVTLQALARSGAETTTEEIQAILSEVGNDVLNGLKNDIPEADWDAHWDNFGSRNLETFLSISPYASLGAFVRDRGVDKSIAMANEASADELVASGYKKEKVQNFQESEDIGKRKAFFEMLESQDPTRPETKEAVDNLAKLNEMAKKTQAEYSQLRISPGVRMDPKKKGYEVYNTESGDIIATLETAQQATETVFEIFGVKENQRQAAFDELVSKFEAGRLDVDESGEMVEIETRTFTQADALVELPGSDARIETEAKLIEQRNGGTGEVTEEVMSGGQTIFGVYIPAGQMGRKEAATKIFNGSSILTLIHERGHGKRRILMANGKWSRSQQIGSLKALDGMLDEGDRFLPATFEAMSESDQEVALDEAVAELAEVLALRTRNGKKSKMRQLLSKNLSAMVRSRKPGAVQLKAFVDAIKEFFGLALRRAAVMKKAEREGKLSSAQLDALSDMLVGTTSQESFESERDAVPTKMVDGKIVDVPFSVSQSKTGMKPPKGVTSKTTEALPVWNISKQEDSLPKVIGNEKSRETFFARLDSALEWLRKDPAKIGTAGGWVTFLRKAGVYGDVPMPPTGITELFKDPAGYAAKVRGAYHGDLTIEGTNASAKQGLDGTSEMRDLIGKGNAPAPWAVALHHMWGILSRMLPPIDQEGMWLRLIAHRPVLDAIQSSIDGKFNLSLKQWQDLVQDARAASADAAGKIGNNATANANSFYLMLERLSGRWQDVADVYAAKDSREMGRRFWSLDAGALGIKNKVQRFIGLTFGVPGVIMDRWKFVELWLPTAVKGTDSESSKEYFKYSNSKPESPLPIYGVYGDLDAKNIVVSTALYEGLEVAMQEAINRSSELQDLLGDHQNPGGLHWYGWNAIKNEAVGHSSLDLTKDLIKNYGLDFGVDAVVKQINEGEYFTEGTIGSSENAKVFLRNGKIDVSRTRISSGLQSGRGAGVLGRGASKGDGESGQGVSFSLGRAEVTSNYVIFNDADITITEENGKPVSPSFQIGDTKMLSDLAENAKRRAKRPETRAMVFKDIAERLNKLRRDVPRIIKSFGKEFEQAEIIDPRTMKSLRKEAAFRQALKQEELEQEILQKEGQALQSGDVPVLKDMPVHGFIANVGKSLAGGSMESRSAYQKRTGRKPGAEYEGSEGMVGGLLYGGGRSPDQVAQELFEENLIPDDSPAAMWEALASERESVTSQKADFKAAMAKLRGVKSEAKTFADEWLKGEIEKQKRDYNPTERTKRALVMYDAILKALPPKLRGSMGGFVQIGNLKTDEARLKFLEKKLDKADDVVERFIKREMTKEAKKLIKSGLATIKTGEVDKGTKGATVHRLFEVIKDVFSGATTVEAVIAGMEKERQIREDSGQLTAEWDGYYNTAPSIVEGFAEWKEQTAEEMTVAVENAAAFYERGWLQSKIKAALRSEMIEAAIQNLRDGKSDEEIDEAITKSEEAIGSMWDNTKSIGREFIDFEQFLISTFGRIDVVNQLVDREYESYRDREQMRVEREYDESQFYADLFNGDIVKGYRYKYDLKTERVKLDSLGSKGAQGSMTKSQIIHWLMMYRQADGRRHFDGDGKRWEFTPEFFVQLEEKLDDRDMKVMEWYSEQYAGEWEVVNPIYEEIRGSTLVKNEVYSPVTVAPKMISIGGLAGAVMDPLSGEQVGAMEATPSMFKRRSKSAVARPRVEGAIEIFQAHKTQVEHWVATAELTRDMKALFGRREAREIVEAKVGKSGLGQLQKWIEAFAKEGIKDTSVGMSFWSMIDRSISRVSRYSLFAKMSTIFIQASQVAGAAAQIPARAYMSKLSKAAVGQLDLSSAWRSPYIQGRLADTLPMVRLAYSNSKTKKPTQLSFYSDKIGQAIGFSDAIFTTATYAAIFDHVKNEIKQNQGLTGTALEAAAHKEAGKRTERVAQPVRKARRSLIENWAQGNVALRAVFAFTSEPRQKLGSAFWEMFHAVRKRDRVKNAMVYGIGFAILGSFIRAAMSDVRDEGEDDEFFDEENWNVDKLILKSMTDNFNGVPIAGPVAEDAFISLAKKLGMDTPPSFPNEGLISDPSKAIPAAERLITLESMENSHEFAKDVRKTLQSAAIFSERATTAAVFWNMVEEVIRTMPVVE